MLDSRRHSGAVPSLERKRIRAYLLLIVADITAIFAGFVVGGLVYRGSIFDAQALLEAQLFIPLFLTIALYQRVFSIRALTDGEYAVLRLFFAVFVAAALLNFLAFYAKFNTSFSRGTFTLGLILSSLLMALIHSFSARFLRKKWGPIARNVLVLDAGGPEFFLDHASHIDAESAGILADSSDPHMMNKIAVIFANQEEVIVSCMPDQREAWANILKASGVHGELVSDAPDDQGIIGITRHADPGMTGIVYSTGPLGLRARLIKRVFDIGFASISLVVLSPLLVLAAIAVKLGDGGPILFVQQRTGRGNRLFPALKFRSMRSDAKDSEGKASTQRTDERVTKVGAFLRKTSIDELPQLLNVLWGNMSIVGPRPHAIGSQAGDKLFWEVDGRYWRRHSLKPGLTGLAQIRGLRGATDQEVDLSDRLAADLEYIAKWSLIGDMIIILRTLTVLSHDKAY